MRIFCFVYLFDVVLLELETNFKVLLQEAFSIVLLM